MRDSLYDKTAAPRVTVIVLNWNGCDDTLECVEALRKLSYPNYNIVIIDNGSTDGSEEIFRKKFPELTVLRSDVNLGFAGGSNMGLRYALKSDADYVLLLNNDTVTAPDFISELVRVAESDSRIGMLSSKIYFYDRPGIIWYAGASFHTGVGWGRLRGYNTPDNGQFNTVEETERASGCSLLATRELCEKVGLLDEKYFCYCEDLDWGLRARRAGFRIMYVPSSKVWHKVSKSTGGNRKAIPLYYSVRNTLRCLDMNDPVPFMLRYFRYSVVLGINFLSIFTMGVPKILGIRRICRGAGDFFHCRYGEFKE